MLDSETPGPGAWEQLHDVGAAHLVFVVSRQVMRATSQGCETVASLDAHPGAHGGFSLA